MTTPSISADDLRAFIATRERQEGKAFDLTLRRFSASVGLIRTFLGEQWTQRNIFGQDRPAIFTSDKAGDAEEQLRQQARPELLAEQLFNLQDVPGFREMCERFRAKDEIEGLLGELDAARCFRARGLEPRFVAPQGRKGHDYDLEFRFAGAWLPCETKAKSIDTKVSADSVYESLQRAAEQVPKDRPSLAYLRVPTSWPKEQNSFEAVKTGVFRHFGVSKRLTAVIMTGEAWVGTLASGGVACITLEHVFPNAKTRNPQPDLVSLLSVTGQPRPSAWVDFATILAS
jgi:hypothetical protein